MGKFKYEKYDYTKVGICGFKSLKSSWSVDFTNHFIAFSNEAAERELTALLSQQIAAEIDRQILEMMRNG